MALVASNRLTKKMSLYSFRRFIRTEYLAFSLALSLLGLATATPEPQLPLSLFLIVLGVVFALHVFIYLMNDLCDLKYDREHPARQSYPLVQGIIKPWQAWLIALGALPVAFALTRLGNGGPLAYLALCTTIGSLAFYNIWGKKFIFPPIVDLGLGVGYASTTVYCASMISTPSRLTWIVAAWIICWTLQINLIGTARDHVFDRTLGARTTAIIGGVEARGKGLLVPGRLVIYSIAIEAALCALLLFALFRDGLGYSAFAQKGIALLILGVEGSALLALRRIYHVAKIDSKAVRVLGAVPIGLELWSIVLLLAPTAYGWPLALIGVLYFLPALKLLKKGYETNIRLIGAYPLNAQ